MTLEVVAHDKPDGVRTALHKNGTVPETKRQAPINIVGIIFKAKEIQISRINL